MTDQTETERPGLPKSVWIMNAALLWFGFAMTFIETIVNLFVRFQLGVKPFDPPVSYLAVLMTAAIIATERAKRASPSPR